MHVGDEDPDPAPSRVLVIMVFTIASWCSSAGLRFEGRTIHWVVMFSGPPPSAASVSGKVGMHVRGVKEGIPAFGAALDPMSGVNPGIRDLLGSCYG